MIVDVIIAVLVIGAGFRGWRRGAAIQVVSIVGFFLGLSLGAVLVVVVAPHVSNQVAKTTLSLFLLLGFASLFGSLARPVGVRLGRIVRRFGLGSVDALIGATVSIGATLIVCWLFASILVNVANPTISSQIESSRIVREAQQVLPPIPDAFAAVERYLSNDGFPQVLVNVLPESIGPVRLPSTAELALGARAASAATVKIVAVGCGEQQEGSGFVVEADATHDLVVTNAHVVAGTTDIAISAQNGEEPSAKVILFDPKFDLAVLEIPSIGVKPLVVDPSFVNRGTPAIELGYPEGGPLNAEKAGIASRFAAEGRDIYDRSVTTRTVYELQANVRPGDSGGPLVAPNGEVEGVVFSRSVTHKDVGFALASPAVLQRVDTAIASNDSPVSTQGCAN